MQNNKFYALILSFVMVFILDRVNGDCQQHDLSSGTVTSLNANSVNALEGPSSAFDGNTDTKWLDYSGSSSSVWIQYEEALSFSVSKYAITSANDAPERDPASWIVYGSTDGSYYVTLDSQQDIVFTERNERKTFSISSPGTYSNFKFEFTSVRDSESANSLQLADIQLWTGDCEDSCCGVECGEHGNCVDGSCKCATGYSGTNCATIDPIWRSFDDRSLTSAQSSTHSDISTSSACKELCISDDHISSCIGVTYKVSDSTCQIHTGTDYGVKSLDGSQAYIYVSQNLQVGNTNSIVNLIDVAETKAVTVSWDVNTSPAGALARVSIFQGEVITFSWEDKNTYYGYTNSNPSVADSPNHHSVYLFPNLEDYVRCDFDRAQILAVSPNFPWTTTVPGDYYFGSRFGSDCNAGQLKIIVEVRQRPPRS